MERPAYLKPAVRESKRKQSRKNAANAGVDGKGTGPKL